MERYEVYVVFFQFVFILGYDIDTEEGYISFTTSYFGGGKEKRAKELIWSPVTKKLGSFFFCCFFRHEIFAKRKKIYPKRPSERRSKSRIRGTPARSLYIDSLKSNEERRRRV